MNVYFISGLGADKRAFSFLDLSFCNPVFIEWIKPSKNETLKEYAIRLRNQIPEKDPIVVGVSFGGMLVTEIAKEDENVKGIIISSNKTSKEFPGIYRAGKYFPAYKWLPSSVLKKMLLVFRPMISAKGIEQKKIIKQIIIDSDIDFLKWALNSILYWENEQIPKNIIHIHGTADKLLPYRLVKADHTIKNGRHLMIMDEFEEVSSLLKELIA